MTWCRLCAAFSSRWQRQLLKSCPGKPRSLAQRNVLRRLSAGLAPTTAHYLTDVARASGKPVDTVDAIQEVDGRHAHSDSAQAAAKPSTNFGEPFAEQDDAKLHGRRGHHLKWLYRAMFPDLLSFLAGTLGYLTLLVAPALSAAPRLSRGIATGCLKLASSGNLGRQGPSRAPPMGNWPSLFQLPRAALPDSLPVP